MDHQSIIQMPGNSGLLPENLSLSQADIDEIMREARRMMELLVDYKDLRMTYTCALKTIRTRCEVLDTEFKVKNQHNPISFISTRVKSNQSIVGKMARKGIPFSIENMEKNILDIAGIRIICSYMDDIYALADALLRQDDIKLLRRKDYIAHPKPNGYRSLHLIVTVPVFFAGQRREIPVEVQIRTIAMDFWASLEHQMKYKQCIDNQETIIERLHSCAERIAALDSEMQEIRQKIENAKDKPGANETLMQRVARLEDPID